MRVIVSDTCAISNLRNGELLDLALTLPFGFAIPDLLASTELTDAEVTHLLENGVEIVELEPIGVLRARDHQTAKRKLSLVDCFALTIAEARGWCLLTDDGLLRKTAQELRVDMHGTLWLVEEMARHQVCASDLLSAGVTRMASHPTARLPNDGVAVLLERLQSGNFAEPQTP